MAKKKTDVVEDVAADKDGLTAETNVKTPEEPKDAQQAKAPVKRVGERVGYWSHGVLVAADVTRVKENYGIDLIVLDPDFGPKVKKHVRYSATPVNEHWTELE